MIDDLKLAISDIKTLSCRKIRDDKGYWSEIESYIHEHSEATLSHGLCPECRQISIQKPTKGFK